MAENFDPDGITVDQLEHYFEESFALSTIDLWDAFHLIKLMRRSQDNETIRGVEPHPSRIPELC